jgi:integrase
VTRDALAIVVEAVDSDGLSKACRTKSGVVFDATLGLWAYRDGIFNVSLNFASLEGLSEPLMRSFKKVMASIAQTQAPSSLASYFQAMKQLFDHAKSPTYGLTEVTGFDFLNFHSISTNVRTVAHTKSILRKWHRLGISGLSPDVLRTLSETKIKGGAKGVAVATRDVHLGPFTDLEFEAILQAITSAYSEGNILASAYVMTWVFIATGARPTQIAAMKIKDFHALKIPGGVDYSIDVPKAKKGQTTRASFTNRPLSKQIGSLIAQYAAAVQASFFEVLGNPEEAPLFPANAPRTPFTKGMEYHHAPSGLGRVISTSFPRLRVISERTGEPMRITPIRFRRTLGTRAAQEGHGVLVIAELLDHVDTQHAGVYVETRPDIATRIDKAVALELAPIAQAFAGKLIRHEGEATRAGDTSSQIRDLRVSNASLASCGQHSFCGMSAPVACYTCDSFEPWIDGPHEAVLDHLLAKRSRQMLENDPRVATVLDRTIIAVAQVVQLCKQQQATSDHVDTSDGVTHDL